MSQQQLIQALIDYARGSTHPDGRVGNAHNGYPTTQTSLGFWSLASAAKDRDVSVPDLRPAGIKRYEDNHATVQYNGRAYNANFASDWTRLAVTSASTGYVAQSKTSPNSISLDFSGRWVSVGFMGTTNTGQAQILIDDEPVAIIDTYRRTLQSLSHSWTLENDGPHTIEIKVLDQRSPFSTDDLIYFDYFDVWDGTEMPAGTFEQHDDARVRTSTNWQLIEQQSASAGNY